MIDMSIRQARSEDLPAITSIYNEVILEGKITADLQPYSIEQRRSWFEDHSKSPYDVFVLEYENKILGYFYFSPWRAGRAALRGIAEISFFLEKSSRGRGIGDIIMKQSIDLAKDRQFKYLIAILMDINNKSESLLSKWGFTVVGELPDVIELPDMHAGQLIMLKTL